MKVRKVDFSPDEYIAGVGNILRADEQGVYWMICAMIYSAGGPIQEDEKLYERLAKLCRMRRPDAQRTVEKLIVEYQKLIRTNDGKLSQTRVEAELNRATNRIQTARENGLKGGRPPKKNKRLPKPGGFSRGKLSPSPPPAPSESSSQDSLFKEQTSDLKNGAEVPPEMGTDFELWYDEYPLKRSPAQALKAFIRARRNGATLDDLIQGAIRYRNYPGRDPKYTKHPATWLNGECWRDELPEVVGGPSRSITRADLVKIAADHAAAKEAKAK